MRSMTYLWFKSFHLIGVVVWFSGLFYLVRLFVYHVEAQEQPEPARTILQQQYQIMEKRLYNLITTPGMIVTLVMAIAMLTIAPEYLKDTWLQVKLGLVVLLVGYHHYCGRLIRQFAAGHFRWNGQHLRALNEVPTVFLVAIVLLVIFKQSLPTDAAVWSIAAMVVVMAATIQLYAKKRRKDKEQLASQITDVAISSLDAKGSVS
jgi:protoporphyrinogen IX oxidase